MAKKLALTKGVWVRVDPIMHAYLSDKARESDRTIQSYIRHLIRVDRRGPLPGSVEERKNAKRLVHKAWRAGDLTYGPCESCGGQSSVLHHHDYSKPLDVIPLCVSCHVKVHMGTLEEPRTGRMYPLDPRVKR